ncbi:hypothetical protein AB0K09_15855 [Streptomyces sp. NPDC049577]|uniref:hypothetical protein n=1 Tax=Streptomyces sp. NPDC049577 TaxID=3155153 RepID=UPI00341A9A46
MYNLITRGDTVPARIGQILAGEFGVPVGSVEVSQDDDHENRNWEAAVACECARIRGDLDWSVTVAVDESVRTQPSEEQVALAVARGLKVSVLFPDKETIPWIWRVALPTGHFTHARVTEPESDIEGLTVDAVELAVADFPNAAVIKFPERIRELYLVSPVLEQHAPAGATEETTRVCQCVANWERLTIRMAGGWPPSSWYPAEMYQEDLELRGLVEQDMARLPEAEQAAVRKALGELDVTFQELTLDDGGSALAMATGTPVDVMEKRDWYWRRRPITLPWDSMG